MHAGEYKSEHAWREVCAASCTGHIQRNTLPTPDSWIQDIPRNLPPGRAHTKCPFCAASGPHSSVGAQRAPSGLLADPVGGGTLPLRAEPPPQTPAKTVKATGRAGGALRGSRRHGPRALPHLGASGAGSGHLSRRLERPSSLSEPSARECGAECAGRHLAPRPLPWPPATPRAVDSSGAWAQGDLGPPAPSPPPPPSPQPGLEELRAQPPPDSPTHPRGRRGPSLAGRPSPGPAAAARRSAPWGEY